ncbi:penicillin-binding protein activator [Xanthomonadaceae bacterium JHOS43]|nr:penicillin-binding protein activator [Xanthomonadaceae bacterium JHOS43]MCX7562806.1 penicillin-binding protein activator [Xanthomonadaceae bacterium XH05]
MPRTLSRLFLPILACAVLLCGCDSMPTKATSDAAIAAESDFARGDFARAAEGFLDAAASHRSQRDLLRLRAAEAWREEGELERAASALEGVSTRRFDGDALQRLALVQAEIALARRQPEQALTLLDGISSSAPKAHRARQLELRARAAEASDNLFLAATARAELDAVLPRRERSENARSIQSLLTRLDDNALSFGAASLPAGHALYPYAARTMIARGLALPRPYTGDLPSDADERVAASPDGYRPFNRIALLLPLDGALGNAAQAVRDGFIAGYYDETRSRPEVRVYATGNRPESALEAYRTALHDGAQAIVGPLGREEVMAIFDADREGTVPLLALNRGGATPPPPGSMSFALTPEDEGVAAANRISERGGLRVLAVRGDDEYGQRATAALAQRLEQRGGRIVATVQLPEGNPNFGAAINSAIAQAGARAVAADGDTRIEQNRMEVDADAIFFAGRAEQARLLVPQLRVAGVYDLPIYATSQITAGAGNARLDRELDGIEFTEAPWLLVDQLAGHAARNALSGLETTRGGSARLFAFGLDAFRLIGYFEHLARDPQATLTGATGVLRFDGFGQILRTPGWARFQGGRIQPAREPGLIGDDIQFRQP